MTYDCPLCHRHYRDQAAAFACLAACARLATRLLLLPIAL